MLGTLNRSRLKNHYLLLSSYLGGSRDQTVPLHAPTGLFSTQLASKLVFPAEFAEKAALPSPDQVHNARLYRYGKERDGETVEQVISSTKVE